ncbi:MAG: sugar kinase [Candidatus Krumholzibacteria bacterium]|nr:sugar kinase [Candidatus Krumholzibacteria bacterium]
MSSRYDVTGVGYTAIDYLGVIPRFPEENLKLELETLEVQGGGPAATATVTAARLGLSTAFIGKVGGDDRGAMMLMKLNGEGVDVSSAVLEADALSQFAFIMVDSETGKRTILWTRGTLTPLMPDELDMDKVTSCRGLLVDTLEPAAAAAAAKQAADAGVKVLIDAGTLRDGVREILPHCHYIVASETFAGQISDGRGPEAALEEMMKYEPDAAVVTLGERGCIALSEGEYIEAKGFEVDAVDTTGAGDVFHGACLYAVLREWDIRRCCVFANAVAAMKCRRLGGRTGIPTLPEAIEFLSERVPDLDFS